MLKAKSRIEHVRGTVGSVAFTDMNILKMAYSNRCSDTSDITFGSAYVGQLQVTFYDLNIPRGEWQNKTITLEYGLELEDQTVEWIPAGVFYVTSAIWAADGVTVVANDLMAKFDKSITLSSSSGRIYDFLNLACLNCGVTLALSRAEVEALPNGDQILGIYAENDMKSWRDLVSWCAATIGGYATATRDGKLTVRSWTQSTVVDHITDEERISGSSFSDYTTRYSGIRITDIKTDMSLTYGTDSGGGYIKIGSDPLLQFGVDSVKDAQRMTLAHVAQGLRWTPWQSSVLSCLVYDLGDLITCSGGIAGDTNLTCGVHYIAWTFKATTVLGGYGADPNLVSGKSKTDKDLSGLQSKQRGSTPVTLYFTNATSYNLGVNWLPIGQIGFAVPTAQTVELKGIVKMNLTSPGDVQIRFLKNGTVQPSTSLPFIYENPFARDKGTATFFFPVNVDANLATDLSIEIRSANATGTIAIQDVWLSITAVGAESLDWAGVIQASDDYSLHIAQKLFNGVVEDTDPEDTNFNLYDRSIWEKLIDTPTDNYHHESGDELDFDLDEGSVSLTLIKPVFDLYSSDGEDQVVSSDEEYFIQSS